MPSKKRQSASNKSTMIDNNNQFCIPTEMVLISLEPTTENEAVSTSRNRFIYKNHSATTHKMLPAIPPRNQAFANLLFFHSNFPQFF